MATQLTGDLLANGQLPNTKTALYTAASVTVVSDIQLVNTDTVTRTVNLYIKRTTSRRLIPMAAVLVAGANGEARGPFTLAAGDLIEGDASVATVVDYSIHGARVQ